MPTVYTETGQACRISESDKVGGGGEGTVYAVPGRPGTVVKIYGNPPTPDTRAKLDAMLANPPAQSAADVVWPTGLAKDQRGDTIGFFMPQLPPKSLPIQKLLTPTSRELAGISVGLELLTRIAANLATAVGNVHDSNNTAGKVTRAVGDINESNVFATPDGLVRIIDTDSFQIGSFRCRVGKPDYTPPELQGVSFDTVDRTPNHDCFALAVMIFRLLAEGQHPYVGTNNAAGGADSPEQRIKNHLYPQNIDGNSGALIISNRYKKARLSLPPAIQSAFGKAFNSSGQPRPTAREWAKVLGDELKKMETCPDGHRKFRHPAICNQGALDISKIPSAKKTTQPRKQRANANPARQQSNPTANRKPGNRVSPSPTPARQPRNSGNSSKLRTVVFVSTGAAGITLLSGGSLIEIAAISAIAAGVTLWLKTKAR